MREFDYLEELLPDWFKDLRIDYFFTGSKVFGCDRINSDIDVCVPIWESNKIKEMLENEGVHFEESDYNNGFKFQYCLNEINIIPLHQVEYVAWFKVAEIGKLTFLLNEKDKYKRHLIHQQLINAVKTKYLDIDITNKNYNQFL